MKKYIVCILMILMILSIGIVSNAANESITATLNKKINIIYNEEIKTFSDVQGTKVYPILYQGTTYLPVRAISALFDIPVLWDGENNKIYLDKGELDTSTAKTTSVFIEGENETVSPYLNKDIKIEYKERIQTFTDVNGTVVYPLSYNGTTYLPVRAISKLYGAEINWNGAEQKITIVRENKIAEITNVTIKVIDDTVCAVVTTKTPLYDYKYYSLTEPNRLILDLENSKFGINKEAIAINYNVLDKVRFGDQGNNVSRIVLDLQEIDTYTVVQSEDRLTTYLALSSNFEIASNNLEEDEDFVLVASIGDKIYIPNNDKVSSGDKIENEENSENNSNNENSEEYDDKNNENIDDKNDETNIPNQDESDNSGDNENIIVGSGDEDLENNTDEENTANNNDNKELTLEQIAKLAKVTAVTYSSSTDKTKVNIDGNYEYEVFLLENPTRLVIDIKQARLDIDGPTEITPRNKNIKEIRFSQNEQDIVRVVFELDEEVEYKITEKSSYFYVQFEEPKVTNVKYKSHDDSATLTLKNVKKKVFTLNKLNNGEKYSISFNSSSFETQRESLDINDDFVKEIDVRTKKIEIKGNGKISCSMKQEGNDVVITITKKGITSQKENDDFVVLIDAGHGGKDPGACHNGGATVADLEKTYTLSIMLKLKELLEDTEGVEVRASRTEDVYIDREGRIDFVLDNPDADLLVSVHINSLANKSYKGTMVLFYNKPNEEEDYGITSKELATLIKNNLVEDLELVDRGVVSRNDLWILEQNAAGEISNTAGEIRPVTNLPAALCELCFISNEEDFSMLKTEEFQDGAALAIYNGIIAAKEQMGK